MAEYKQGDRVVKMSGAAAGKYGTVNSVRDDGTLNVTFDGERLPRYCDPMRCGKVAANAAKPVGLYRGCKISVADHSPDDITRPGKTYIVEDADGVSVGGFVTSDAAKRWCDQHPSRCANSRAANAARNAVARNAGFKIGDRVIIKEWAKQKRAGYGRGTIIKKVGAQFLVRPDGQSHEKYYVPTYAWNEDDLVAANAARNAVARNDMWELEKGDRVKIKRTGETGVVTHVYGDGAISVMRDNGAGTILDKRELEWLG